MTTLSVTFGHPSRHITAPRTAQRVHEPDKIRYPHLPFGVARSWLPRPGPANGKGPWFRGALMPPLAIRNPPLIRTVNPVTIGPGTEMPPSQRWLAIRADTPAAASSRVTQGIPAADRECRLVPPDCPDAMCQHCLASRTDRFVRPRSPAPECRLSHGGARHQAGRPPCIGLSRFVLTCHAFR